MTVARHYVMRAAAGQSEALNLALGALADAVRLLPGSEGVDLLRNTADDAHYVFIEKWASIEAHKAAGPLLSKDVMAPVMGALEGRPEGAYLDYLKTV